MPAAMGAVLTDAQFVEGARRRSRESLRFAEGRLESGEVTDVSRSRDPRPKISRPAQQSAVTWIGQSISAFCPRFRRVSEDGEVGNRMYVRTAREVFVAAATASA